MTGTVYIHPDASQKAKQLRTQASTAAQIQEALSVILVAAHGFDADRTVDAWTSAAARFFVMEIIFALKMTCAKIRGAVAGILLWVLKKSENSLPNGAGRQYRKAS